MILESRERNCRTSSLVLASRRSVSPDSSSWSSSRSRSSVDAWVVPALSNCPCSSNCTIVSSRFPTSWLRACSNTFRNNVARRGSLGASRSAKRKNVLSNSRNCLSNSCSRCAKTAGEPVAGTADAGSSAKAIPSAPGDTITNSANRLWIQCPAAGRRARVGWGDLAGGGKERVMVAAEPRGPAVSAV